MGACSICGRILVWGGQRYYDLLFCSNRCSVDGAYLMASYDIPDEDVAELALRWHRGDCPICGREGPVDVHRSYTALSAVLITRCKSKQQISCRACGLKSQASAFLSTLVCGWWAIPLGLILTPIQMIRTLIAASFPPAPHEPSKRMLLRVRYAMGEAGDGELVNPLDFDDDPAW